MDSDEINLIYYWKNKLITQICWKDTARKTCRAGACKQLYGWLYVTFIIFDELAGSSAIEKIDYLRYWKASTCALCVDRDTCNMGHMGENI